jgi:hypothetical protein
VAKNSHLSDARRQLCGAKKKFATAIGSAKDGIIQEGGAIADWVASGKGKKAFGQALKAVTSSFNEHRDKILGAAGKKK